MSTENNVFFRRILLDKNGQLADPNKGAVTSPAIWLAYLTREEGDKVFVRFGTARMNPNDKFNKKMAKAIALGRVNSQASAANEISFIRDSSMSFVKQVNNEINAQVAHILTVSKTRYAAPAKSLVPKTSGSQESLCL